MDMESIITRLGEIQVLCIKNQLSEHADACSDAVSVFYALLEEGARDIERAKDIVHDYRAMAKQYQTMHKRFEVANHVVRNDGAWHCPSCNCKVSPYHSYCHACGKRLDWGGGKGGQR